MAVPDPTGRLLSAGQVAALLAEALGERRSCALVRLGDGEALTLAHDLIVESAEAARRGAFLRYAGVVLPDHATRRRLAEAVRRADIVGLTTAAGDNYWPLLAKALAAHDIDLEGTALTDAVINYLLHDGGHLGRLLLDRRPRPRVLAVGNLAPRLAPVLADQGVDVAGVVYPVLGCNDVDRVLAEMVSRSYDVALVAGGVAAVILCAESVCRRPSVAIDLGHLADELIDGSKTLRPRSAPR